MSEMVETSGTLIVLEDSGTTQKRKQVQLETGKSFRRKE
jgi:hypothetical protein